MPYYIRPMQREDIPQVKAIDRQAFPTMLPPPNFERELRNQMTHFYVVCDSEGRPEPEETEDVPAAGPGLFGRIKKWFNQDGQPETGRAAVCRQAEYVCGYVGFWVMADEAHITTIAVRDKCQRQGLGELLIMTVIDRAQEFYASVVTLEVRVSNTGAQRLYDKYGFARTGVRKRYYTDNHEDAYIMTTGDITSSEYRNKIEELSQEHKSRWGEARFSFS